MKHTLGTAAKATEVSKSTIYRAVKSGKLSASRSEDGEYEIDPAELHRVYPPVPERANTAEMERNATPRETTSGTSNDTGNAGMSLWLREKLDATERELKETRNELADTNTDLMDTKERLNEHREAARLLEHKTEEQKQQIDSARREADQWKNALSERRAEIERARAEAAELNDAIKQTAMEKAKAEARALALESRGLIDRILNRKPETSTE